MLGRWLNWVVLVSILFGFYSPVLWTLQAGGTVTRRSFMGCRVFWRVLSEDAGSSMQHLTAVLFRISRFVVRVRDVVVSASALRALGCGLGGCDGIVMLRGEAGRLVTVVL